MHEENNKIKTETAARSSIPSTYGQEKESDQKKNRTRQGDNHKHYLPSSEELLYDILNAFETVPSSATTIVNFISRKKNEANSSILNADHGVIR